MHRTRRLFVALTSVALLAGACSSDEGNAAASPGVAPHRQSIQVQPDLTVNALNVNVLLTDEGIEPDIIFLPAGRPIRLVLKNRGTSEHHFRIKGLIPSQLRWMQVPEIDEYDAESMSPEDLAAYGIMEAAGITDEAELAHYFHHLTPQMVPFKDESPAGIRVLGTEVHGYVGPQAPTEVMEFFALQTGEYIADDVRFPEFTARVIVFAAEGS